MMKTNNWILFLLLLVIPAIAQAQQTEDLKKEINKIKKSSLYLYAETTMPDKQEALATAIDILQSEVHKWVNNKKKKNEIDKDIVLTNIEQFYYNVELPRGNMFRAFAYIKKSDIITAHNTLVTQAEEAPQTTVEVKSKVKKISKPKIELPPVIVELLKLKKYDEVPSCLEKLKQRGLITEYKRYAELTQVDEYVLIIYNRQAEVEAILSEGPQRINYANQQADGVKNYKGRGAIGVKLSK